MTAHSDGDWWAEENGLRTAIAGKSLTLHAQSGPVPSPCDLPGVRWQLREWTQYNLVANSPITAVLGVPATPVAGDRRIWTFQLRNQIGRLRLRVQTAEGWFPSLDAEVLSAKFDTPATHIGFLEALTTDLTRLTRHAEFVPAAATSFGVEPDPRGPSLLSDLNTLMRWVERLPAAVEGIVHAPHRQLTEFDDDVGLSEIRHVTPALVAQLAGLSGELSRVPDRWPLHRWTRGVVPRRLIVSMPEETLDTPENRFVRLVLAATQDALHAIRRTSWIWESLPAADRGALTNLGAEIEYQLAASFLGELDPAPLPTASQVLARQPAYREVWEFWQDLASGRRTILSEADNAIAARDIATLYEIWGFFALCERLGPQLGSVQRWRHIRDERAGVPHGALASFNDGWSVVYNRGYRRPRAYAVGLRPDYTLRRGEEPVAVFDAKFRFDVAPEAELVDEDEAAIAPDTGTVVATDIVKMHAYRDALGVGSAVVLFPGGEDRFFSVAPERGRDHHEVPLADIVTRAVEGVGAIALRP